MYAMLSIVESLVELTRAVREINERGRAGAPNLCPKWSEPEVRRGLTGDG